MRRWLSVIPLLVISALLLACGGSGNGSEPGAKDPETAVRNLLDAILDEDDEAIDAALDPYFDDPADAGVSDLIRLAGMSEELTFDDIELTTEYDSTRQHARVFVNMKVTTEAGDAALDDKVLLTSIVEERWFVTSPSSEYWAAQLRPSPAEWPNMQADANPSLPGVYVPPHPGVDGILLNGSNDDRAHIGNETSIPICTAEQIASNSISSPLCYPSNPPTSGPHAASAAPFRVFTQPVAKEFLVHSMEHGGVVIWYNSNDPTVIQTLAALTDANISRGKQVVLSPYSGMEANTIAVTSWTRIDKFTASPVDTARIQRFINTHERRFNPEGF